jgi:hypothetical protein
LPELWWLWHLCNPALDGLRFKIPNKKQNCVLPRVNEVLDSSKPAALHEFPPVSSFRFRHIPLASSCLGFKIPDKKQNCVLPRVNEVLDSSKPAALHEFPPVSSFRFRHIPLASFCLEFPRRHCPRVADLPDRQGFSHRPFSDPQLRQPARHPLARRAGGCQWFPEQGSAIHDSWWCCGAPE